MTVGTVLRSHAGGYLVYQADHDLTVQCQARGRLKKERVSIVTGDRVELEDLDLEQATGVITGTLDRWSLLPRPLIANVDQVVIVQAVRQPEWNQLWCDRYIVHFQLELPDTMPILCFNKCDLVDEDKAQSLCRIYESLGYKVVTVSAKTSMGLAPLAGILESKITVFAGPSGVGKSSLLNALEPTLNLKIGVMDHDFGVGRHTTTYSEVFRIQSFSKDRFNSTAKERSEVTEYKPTWVADTPGFNLSELRHPEPVDVMWQFPEILNLSQNCRFSDCLHLVEAGCNVVENILEDEVITMSKTDGKIPLAVSRHRYDNYVTIVRESQEEQESRREQSHKKESAVKKVGGRKGKAKSIPRLSNQYRAKSRRSEKQALSGPIDYKDELQSDESD